jgi:hypothetical protein
MTIKMIDKMFLNPNLDEELDEEDKRLQALTKANLKKLESGIHPRDKWLKKGVAGHAGALAQFASTGLNTM